MDKKQLIVILVVLFIVCSIDSFAEEKTNVVWQQSESLSVKLGVRDKYSSLEKYKALFVIKAEDDKEYKVERSVEGDSWGYVYFPDDFEIYGEVGYYTWECFVGGEVVAKGEFRLTTVESYFDQATVMRK